LLHFERLPSQPVDPWLIVVAGAHIDVLAKDDRNVDVAWRLASRSIDRSGLLRLLQGRHLTSSRIEPVTPSAIATRIRTLPQADVEEVLKPMFGSPRPSCGAGRSR
jgi:hypothetical protein